MKRNTKFLRIALTLNIVLWSQGNFDFLIFLQILETKFAKKRFWAPTGFQFSSGCQFKFWSRRDDWLILLSWHSKIWLRLSSNIPSKNIKDKLNFWASYQFKRNVWSIYHLKNHLFKNDIQIWSQEFRKLIKISRNLL